MTIPSLWWKCCMTPAWNKLACKRASITFIWNNFFFYFCIQKCRIYKNCDFYPLCLISQKSLRFADVLFEIKDISSGSTHTNNVYNSVTAVYYIKDLSCVFCSAIYKTTVKYLTPIFLGGVLIICFIINTFTAIVDLSRFNNSRLKSPASTLVDLTFQSRALRSFSLNQLRNLSL